jgi:hypothetical protein
LGQKLSIILKTLALILAIVTIGLGLNEATKDVLDPLGSNYWLSYSAVLSGIVVIVFVLISWKRPKT